MLGEVIAAVQMSDGDCVGQSNSWGAGHLCLNTQSREGRVERCQEVGEGLNI